MIRSYRRATTAPDLLFPWTIGGVAVDFSTGWTFAAEWRRRSDGLITAFAGTIVGEVGAVRVKLVEADTDKPERTTHELILLATETATGDVRSYRPSNFPVVRIT